MENTKRFMFSYNYIYNIVIQRYVNDTHNWVNVYIMKYYKGYVLLNTWMSLLLHSRNTMHILSTNYYPDVVDDK